MAQKGINGKVGAAETLFTILALAIIGGLLVTMLPLNEKGPELPNKILNEEKFIDQLNQNGVSTNFLENLDMTIFPVPGNVRSVDDEKIIIFEFNNSNESLQYSKSILNNGTTINGNSYVWQAAPHFYQKGQLIVLYIGSTGNIMAVLSYILGQQIAGAPHRLFVACSVNSPCMNNEHCITFVGDTYCTKQDPCFVCSKRSTCTQVGTYPVEVICGQ